LRQAYRLAIWLVDGQYRPCGRPFVNHLAGTASVLLFYGCSIPVVLAALLHAALTHGPSDRAPQSLDTFSQYNEQSKAAIDLVRRYGNRQRIFDTVETSASDLAQLPVAIASLYLLDAANDVDMRLSLEVAVSGRTDVLAGKRLEDFRRVIEMIGLPGLAEVLRNLAEIDTAPQVIPFIKGRHISFKVLTDEAEKRPPRRPAAPLSANGRLGEPA
jgi:hypothetical protein